MDTALGVVVGFVVVLAVAMLVAFLLRRRSAKQQQERLAHAGELRGEAAGHHSDVAAATARARSADAEAKQARARAERAEREAADAHQVLAHVEAEQEDVVRRADEVDARVDTASPGYEPITGPAMKGGADPQP